MARSSRRSGKRVRYVPTTVNLPSPKSRELTTKSEFITVSRVSGDSSMSQVDTILKWPG